MEIKTCEQYVLDQLEQARAERDWLRGVSSGGKLMPFEDWCIEHVGYSSLRYGMTKNEFIAYFEPEFRTEYDELAEEWKAEQE